jgi:hypothetical protein
MQNDFSHWSETRLNAAVRLDFSSSIDSVGKGTLEKGR